ncbi:ABC transporter substrate-binding protein [Rhizobium sp. SYY.PMSO]|uniref:ABC transporter substrate-binding protein n=1 Tax=Rhizobium sp. SYY.PMSO TaxID=3382192 RepID=UPI00398FC41D
MKKALFLAAFTALAGFGHAYAADTKVSIGISGWTGFAPLTLAKEAGIFKKHGLDVTVAKVPQASRHLALASGDIQCAATTVETWIVWNAAGVATTQLFQLDVSHGADGIAAKPGIEKVADLKGKTVAASAPGTSPYFLLAFILAKNGMTMKDVKIVNMEPGPAAQALLAGQNDAAVTYEPYLSAVRAAPDKGKIIATTIDYPAVMDTFGCTTGFLKDHPDAAKALAASYYDALEMIKTDKDKSFEIMGKDVKQTGKEFGESAAYLEWQDKAATKKFFETTFKSFNVEAAKILLDAGVIKQKPDLSKLADPSFIE